MIETYIRKKFTGLDADNTDTATEWIGLDGCTQITYYIEPVTGEHAIHEFTIEVSPDGIYNAELLQGSKITGIGFLKVDTRGLSWVRFKCSTKQGVASTVDIHVRGFRELKLTQ
jgi:hypothetical protein